MWAESLEFTSNCDRYVVIIYKSSLEFSTSVCPWIEWIESQLDINEKEKKIISLFFFQAKCSRFRLVHALKNWSPVVITEGIIQGTTNRVCVGNSKNEP